MCGSLSAVVSCGMPNWSCSSVMLQQGSRTRETQTSTRYYMWLWNTRGVMLEDAGALDDGQRRGLGCRGLCLRDLCWVCAC